MTFWGGAPLQPSDLRAYRVNQFTQSMLLIHWVGNDRESNLKPSDFKANALPTELSGHSAFKRAIICEKHGSSRKAISWVINNVVLATKLEGCVLISRHFGSLDLCVACSSIKIRHPDVVKSTKKYYKNTHNIISRSESNFLYHSSFRFHKWKVKCYGTNVEHLSQIPISYNLTVVVRMEPGAIWNSQTPKTHDGWCVVILKLKVCTCPAKTPGHRLLREPCTVDCCVLSRLVLCIRIKRFFSFWSWTISYYYS